MRINVIEYYCHVVSVGCTEMSNTFLTRQFHESVKIQDKLCYSLT